TVIVESKQLKVTNALRDFAQGQAEKLFKLQKGITKVRIYLETIAKKSNDPMANSVVYRVEVPGKDIVVRKKAVDMYDAIVSATDAAVRKLRKQYEKKIANSRDLKHHHKALT
ncbi:MAG: HPF/RaiA family ribosome-associated protein, partial [Microgenomates group bacterium]